MIGCGTCQSIIHTRNREIDTHMTVRQARFLTCFLAILAPSFVTSAMACSAPLTRKRVHKLEVCCTVYTGMQQDISGGWLERDAKWASSLVKCTAQNLRVTTHTAQNRTSCFNKLLRNQESIKQCTMGTRMPRRCQHEKAQAAKPSGPAFLSLTYVDGCLLH